MEFSKETFICKEDHFILFLKKRNPFSSVIILSKNILFEKKIKCKVSKNLTVTATKKMLQRFRVFWQRVFRWVPLILFSFLCAVVVRFCRCIRCALYSIFFGVCLIIMSKYRSHCMFLQCLCLYCTAMSFSNQNCNK